jgi:hypothetical protein
VGYTVSADPEGGFAVVNLETGLPVATGLNEQKALLQAREQTFIDAGEVPPPGAGAIGPLATPPGGFTPAQLNAIAAAQGVSAGDIDFTQVGPQQTEAALFAAEAATTAALRDQARQQQTIRAQRQNQAQSTDWRVRPEDDEECDDDLAEGLTVKLKHAETESRADRAVSDAYAAQIKAGLGWVEVSREHDPFKCPYRVRYVHRREIFWDWRAEQPDLSDARYLIRRRWLELEHAIALMPQ